MQGSLSCTDMYMFGCTEACSLFPVIFRVIKSNKGSILVQFSTACMYRFFWTTVYEPKSIYSYRCAARYITVVVGIIFQY